MYIFFARQTLSMVKSYTRFELEKTFGIVASASPALHIRSARGPGRVVVAAGEAVQIWDLKTSELESRFVDQQLDKRVQVVQLAYEPASQLVAAGYTDGSIRVWDVLSGSVLVVFDGHKSFVSALQFSKDGSKLFSGGAESSIVVWDLISEQGVCRLTGHRAPITALVLVEDSLVSVGKDGVIKLWDLETRFCTETRVHKGECWGAALVNGELATVGSSPEIRFWRLDFRKDEGERIEFRGSVLREGRHRAVGLRYEAINGLLVCASGDLVQTWRARTPEEIRKLLKRRQRRLKSKNEANAEVNAEEKVGDEYMPLNMFRTHAKITGFCLAGVDVVTNLGANSVEYWRQDPGGEPELAYTVDRCGHRTDVRDCCVSFDGKTVASGSNGLIKVHDARSTNVIRTLSETGYILALKYLPGNQLLAAATKEGTIDLYDIGKSTKIFTATAHTGAVWSLDLGVDGKTLVSGGADKTVKVWTICVDSGLESSENPLKMSIKHTHTLEFSDDVLAVKLSPDMRLLAASLLDNTVKVYKLDTLKFFLSLYGHKLPVLSLDISFDSKLLISGSADKNVKIWGLDFGDCHKSVFAHDDSILRVSFEPESHNFFSASKDGFVKYWDGDKFVLVQTLKGHHSEVWALAVASDGSFLVSASHDKSLRLWEATDEPLFIEEERELELEEQFEQGMAADLNREDNFDNLADAETDGGLENVRKHTLDSLKAGERLYEALEMCLQDIANADEPRHAILTALNVSAEKYLMDVLSRIKTPLVEDALLTFPLDKIAGLLTFIDIWLKTETNTPLVFRVLLFCLQSFRKQLVAAKMLQPELESIRARLRELLQKMHDNIGFNLAGLKLLQQQWNEDHVHVELDSARSTESLQKRAYSQLS